MNALVHFATVNVARGYHCLFITTEMSATEVKARILQMNSHQRRDLSEPDIPGSGVREAYVNNREYHSGEWLSVYDGRFPQMSLADTAKLIKLWRRRLMASGVEPDKCVHVYIDMFEGLAGDMVTIHEKIDVLIRDTGAHVTVGLQATNSKGSWPQGPKGLKHTVHVLDHATTAVEMLPWYEGMSDKIEYIDFVQFKNRFGDNAKVRLYLGPTGRLWESSTLSRRADKLAAAGDMDALYNMLLPQRSAMPGVL